MKQALRRALASYDRGSILSPEQRRAVIGMIGTSGTVAACTFLFNLGMIHNGRFCERSITYCNSRWNYTPVRFNVHL